MAGPVTSEEEILLHIQGLVSDSLAVVSYKGLSRSFSLSSNAAKRLLQKFSEEEENSDLQVVYAISGWSKQEPQSYMIQLAPKSKLEEVKAALKDPPSIHIYSVQRCLPKDPAQLWSSDFVQAERLFTEPAESNNSLRDNRFSAVTCGLVHRAPTRQSSRVTSAPPPPRFPDSKGSDKSPLPSPALVPKVPIPSTPTTSASLKDLDATLKDGSGGKNLPTKPSISPATPHTEAKDSSRPSNNGKRKGPSATIGDFGGVKGNPLASMWGKAPPKKAAVPTPLPLKHAASPSAFAAMAGDAEARIQALEVEDDSEDDMVKEFTSMRRGQAVNGGRRRRLMIVDDGDGAATEGDDSEAIDILERSSEKQRPVVSSVTQDAHATNKGASSVPQKSPSPEREILQVQGKPAKLEPNLGPDLDSETKSKKRENPPEVKANPPASVPDFGRAGFKRKKVLKTRIDERGREVTEVIWEGEEKENVEEDKDQAAQQSASSVKQNDNNPPAVKPQPLQKPSSKPAASKPTTKASGKTASKPAKGQGNITSFFKKK